MSLAIKLLIEPLRSLGFASIGVGYMGIGTAISNEARMVYVSNLTNRSMSFSFDGIHDHFVLPVYGFVLLDVCSNQSLRRDLNIAVGERLYVKQIVAPSAGSVYVTVFYGKDH